MARRIVLIVVCGSLVAGCGPSKPSRYVSAPGKFSADLPASPKESEQSIPTVVGPIPAHSVTGEDANRVIFGVTYADFPANLIHPGNREASLEGSCSGMIAASQATLLEKHNISLGEYPGREVRFEVNPPGMSEKGIGVARIYLVGSRLYQLLTLGGESKFKDNQVKAFFDSFRLEDGTPLTAESKRLDEKPALVGWGAPEDPDGDCRIQAQGSAATIEVPGVLRVLTPGPGGKDNTPKIMRPVDGDFIAEVKVVGDDLPADPPATSSRVAFSGAGLLLRGEAGDLVRLERAAFVRNGRLQTYVLFEHHRPGLPVLGEDSPYPGGPVSLRLERHGGQVLGSFSTDGMNWERLNPKSVVGTGGTVGIVVVNTSSFPFLARFEGLKVDKP